MSPDDISVILLLAIPLVALIVARLLDGPTECLVRRAIEHTFEYNSYYDLVDDKVKEIEQGLKQQEDVDEVTVTIVIPSQIYFTRSHRYKRRIKRK